MLDKAEPGDKPNARTTGGAPFQQLPHRRFPHERMAWYGIDYVALRTHPLEVAADALVDRGEIIALLVVVIEVAERGTGAEEQPR